MSYLTEISDIIYCDLLTLFILFLFNKTAALILIIDLKAQLSIFCVNPSILCARAFLRPFVSLKCCWNRLSKPPQKLETIATAKRLNVCHLFAHH